MQGQPVHQMALIQSGSVKLTQLSASGNEVILWMNGTGDAMGVHADSTSCNHTCSARAIEQCKALVWEYTKLQMLVAEYPQLRKNISQILATRLHELEERFREVATEKVSRRVLHLLFQG
jgi:CRP-like cAMP-binding protein